MKPLHPHRTLCSVLILTIGISACTETEYPPVSEPERVPGMDVFVLEAMQPHIDRAKASPGDSELRGTLGLFYEANKMWMPAREAFRNAHLLDPDKPEWTFHVVITSLLVGDSEEARRQIEGLCQRVPGFSPARYRRGVMLYDSGDLEAALEEFRATQRLEPKCVDAYVSEAEILVQLGKPSEALVALENAKKVDAKYQRIHHVRGLALSDLGRDAEAEVEFHKGLNAKRTSLTDYLSRRKAEYQAGYEARNGTAVDMIDRGNYQGAIDILVKILARMPGDASTSNNLAVAHRRLGQNAKAAEVLKASRDANPEHFPTMINLSGCYWEMKEYEKALVAADRAVELVPENGRALFAKGRALVSLERLPEAVTVIEKAKLTFPEPLVYAILGKALMDLNRLADAEGNWETLVQKVPSNTMAWTNLVTTEAMLGKTEEAREHLLELERLAPKAAATKRLRRDLGPR